MTEEQVQVVEAGGVPVDTLCPGWAWLASIHHESDVPTDREIEQIRSIVEYRLSRYRKGYQTVIREKGCGIREAQSTERVPGGGNLLYDGGSVTYVFKKAGDAWFYRLATWRAGPMFMPERSSSLTLEQVADRAFSVCGTIFSDWLEWKAAHPDLFSGR